MTDRVETPDNVVFFSNVQPRKRKRERGETWSCCGRQVPPYMANCPECGGPRK